MMAQQPQQQQQQYFQYTPQPGVSYPGATAYTYPGAQQPQTMVTEPGTASTTAVKHKFDAKSSRVVVVLATIHVIIGCCCIGFQSTSIYLESALARIYTSEDKGTGIWCGVMFLVIGAFGLCAGKRKSIVLAKAFMVFNILTSVAVWLLLSFAVVNTERVQECRRKGIYPDMLSSVPRTCKESLYSVWIAMDALMITLAVIGFIMAVTSAIYSCRVVCNCCIIYDMIAQQQGSGVHVVTTGQLPSQQQHHQAVESKPYPLHDSYMQYPAAGAAINVSYGQPSYAQAGQPSHYQQQQQQVPLLAAYPQTAYGPYGETSESVLREAAPSGAGYTGQTYYPRAADDRNTVPSAPELPPSYDAAMKL